MGYFLFRTTSDVERLPFPIAPIAAQGATALAEVSEEKESWRWPVFSVGTMIGLVYGFFYVAIPVITGGFLADPAEADPDSLHRPDAEHRRRIPDEPNRHRHRSGSDLRRFRRCRSRS